MARTRNRFRPADSDDGEDMDSDSPPPLIPHAPPAPVDPLIAPPSLTPIHGARMLPSTMSPIISLDQYHAHLHGMPGGRGNLQAVGLGGGPVNRQDACPWQTLCFHLLADMEEVEAQAELQGLLT